MNSDHNAVVSRSASDGQLMESTTTQSSPSLHPRNNDDAEFVVTTLPHSVRTRSRSNSRSRGSFFERRSLISRSKGSNGYVQISDADTTTEIIHDNTRKSNYYHNKTDKHYVKGKDKQQREKALKKSASASSILDKIFDIFLPKPKPRHGARHNQKYATYDFKENADGRRMSSDWKSRKSTSPPLSSRPVSDKRVSNSPKVIGGNSQGTGTIAAKRAVVGVTGLRNHGNTCYMNAVIQCLSHTDTLAEYFVMDLYKIDLRKRSKRNAKKYGTKGEVTEQLAKLLKALWSSQYTPEVSNQFKIVVGNHNEGFKGSEQNDAQEFLIWLLDKVHEDLNTADKKKLKKVVNNHGKHNEDLAAVSLANHQRSNISFVNEIFRAQFQSSVTCHNCQKLSITYDPFLCISVPIPQRQTRPMYCTVVYLDKLPKQVKMGVSVIAHGNIQDLRETLSKETGIPEKQMIITEIHEDNFGRTFADVQPISAIQDSDNVYVVETPCPKPADQREQEEHLLLLWLNRLGAGKQAKRFGCPYTTLVRRMSTYNDLQSSILKEMKAIMNPQVIETVSEAMIRLRVVDGLDGKCYLPDDVEHPLYMQTVDEALATAQQAGHGPQHLKLNVEWDQTDCDRMLADVTDPVEDHPSVDAHRNEQNLPINATLNECFELYLQAEELGVDNQWKCPNCMKHEQCVKKISLWSVPDILVIHLMRFRQTASQRTKLDTLVEFPITGLDMSLHTVHRSFHNNDTGLHHNGLGFLTWSPWKRNQRNFSRGEDANVYDLYGVCNHVGMLQSGHYTAFCKNPTDGLWYNFDDTKVQPIEESAIVTPSAYILFYQRRSMSSGCSSSDSTSSAGSEHWVHRMQPAHFHAKVSKSQDNLSVVGREDKEKEKSKSLRGTRPYASMGALNAHKRHEERKVCRETIEKPHYSDDEDTECYMMMPESSV